MRLLGKYLNDLLESSGQLRGLIDDEWYVIESGTNKTILYSKWLEKYAKPVEIKEHENDT